MAALTYNRQSWLEEDFGLRFAFIDLVNSQQWDGFGHMTDHLANPSWVAAFLAHWGWSEHGTKPLPRRELAALRETVRRVSESIAAGQSPLPADLTGLNTLLAVPQRHMFELTDGSYQLVYVPVQPGWGWIQAQIVESFALFLTHEQRRRLKICPNLGCRWLFYDETHGNIRRWCNDRTCGNRAKVRRHRERKQV